MTVNPSAKPMPTARSALSEQGMLLSRPPVLPEPGKSSSPRKSSTPTTSNYSPSAPAMRHALRVLVHVDFKTQKRNPQLIVACEI
jgi:hypothetical protein